MLHLLVFVLSLTAPSAAASSCAGGYATVCASGCAAATISAAVAAIPTSPLTGDYCVDIRNNAAYAEQVTVQGKSPGNFQIIIGTTTGATHPTLRPPASSTAAFQILNASVTLAGFDIVPAANVPYGVDVTSGYVTISSVNVLDPSGFIKSGGVELDAYGSLSYSTVSVLTPDAVVLNGPMTTVSYSSAATGNASNWAVHLLGAKDTFTKGFVSGGASMDYPGAYDTVSFSTADNIATGSPTTGNRIDSDYAKTLSLYGDHQTVIRSTVVSTGLFGIYLTASSCTITQSFIANNGGLALRSLGGVSNTVVTLSTFVETGSGFGNTAIAIDAGSPGDYADLFYNDYIQGPMGVDVNNSTGVVFGGDTIVATDPGSPAFNIDATGNWNITLTSSALLAPAGSTSGGLWIQTSNSGSMYVTSNTIYGGQWGVRVDTQSAGAHIYITSNTIVPALSATQSTFGLYLNGLTSGATIENNAVVWRQSGSAAGQTAYGLYAQSAAGLNIDHNRVDEPGMITAGSFVGAAFYGTQRTSFKFNDVNSTGTAFTDAYALRLAVSTVSIRDNIFVSSFVVSGSSASLSADAVSGLGSDYNDWYSSTSADTLVWGSSAYAYPWSGAIGQDVHSIAANPLWNDASAGVEDFHPRSSAGRYVPQNGTFVQDAADSPTIDAADPAEAYGGEPAPDGFTANLGSYGDTAQASETAPGQNPSAASVMISSISVSWTSARSAAATGYVVQASTASDFTGTVFSSATSNVSLTRLSVQGLNGSTTYYLRLGTTYGGGSTYVNATPSTADTLAVPATGGQIFAVWPTSITVNWVALSSQAVSYDLETSSDPAFGTLYASSATAGLTQSTLTVTNLAIDATFYFRVGTFNWSGAATYAVAGSTYLGTPPIAVSGLSTVASTAADTQAILSWTAPGAVWNLGAAASYNIRYAQSAITPANFGAAAVWKSSRAVSGPVGTPETETITGLTSGVTYYFALETANSSGSVSGLSNVVSYLAGQDVLAFVRSISPSGANAVSISTTVAVVFSKNVSTSTLGGLTVTAVLDNLGNPINQAVAGTTTYLQASESVIFSPTAALSKNFTYAVRIATTVKDALGGPLAASSATFTTVFDHSVPNVISPGQGVQFTLSAGAFGADGSLAVSTAAQTAAIQAASEKLIAMDSFANPISVLTFSASDLSSSPLEPSSPLTVTVPFNSTVKPGFVDNTSPPVRVDMLALWWLDPATQSWVRLPGASVDAAAHKLTASVPHFSTFAVIGTQDASLSNAFAFPVPYVPSKQAARAITFQNLSSSGRIRIFTISGKLVREIAYSDGTGQATWDVKNSAGQAAASGLYLYVIQSSAESKKGELIIVR